MCCAVRAEFPGSSSGSFWLGEAVVVLQWPLQGVFFPCRVLHKRAKKTDSLYSHVHHLDEGRDSYSVQILVSILIVSKEPE